MIIRKTVKTFKKQIYRGADREYKSTALYRKTTFWILMLPIYSYEEFIS